jgi:hypothetical protein
MRFDNIATAAVTPGGFQGGVNDIIQAILGADAAKQRAAIHEQDAATAQGNVEADRAWRKESLGQQMANHAADQGLRQQEINNTNRHYADQAAQAGAKNMGEWADRAGSVGKNIYQMMTGSGTYKQPASKVAKPMSFADANSRANLDVYGTTDGPYGTKVTKDPVLNVIGEQQAGPDGVPLFKTREKREKRDPTPEERAKHSEALQKYLSTPVQSMGSQVAENAGDLPGEDIPATSEGAVPLNRGIRPPVTVLPPSAAVQKPAIDYNALDAKLQATDTKWRQKRASPTFNWKGALDAGYGQ